MTDPEDLKTRQNELNRAAYDGDLDRVLELLGSPFDQALANGDYGEPWNDEAHGCTTGAPPYRPLSRAASRGHLRVIEALLDASASLDAVTSGTETALHLAVAGSHRRCVEALLDRGADSTGVAVNGSVLAYASVNVEMITFLLDRGVDPRPLDAFGRDAADLLGTQDHHPLKARVAALRLYVARWPEGDPARARHRGRLQALEAELAAKKAKKKSRKSKLKTLITAASLEAEGWGERICAALPQSMWEFDPDLPDEAKPRAVLDGLRVHVLSAPQAIAHPQWPDALRAMIALTPDYREITEDAYGEALDPEDAADDEGGVIDMLEDEEASTIPDALTLLASPAAVRRADWADLVQFTLNAHKERFGSSPVLTFGADEAEELFSVDEVREHPAAGPLWDLADEVYGLDIERP